MWIGVIIINDFAHYCHYHYCDIVTITFNIVIILFKITSHPPTPYYQVPFFIIMIVIIIMISIYYTNNINWLFIIY